MPKSLCKSQTAVPAHTLQQQCSPYSSRGTTAKPRHKPTKLHRLGTNKQKLEVVGEGEACGSGWFGAPGNSKPLDFEENYEDMDSFVTVVCSVEPRSYGHSKIGIGVGEADIMQPILPKAIYINSYLCASIVR
jgi:hypothetical protein